MNISLIAAITKNRVIGKDGKMPWHIPEDLKYFKQITLNKPIIMGRKTFESLNFKPLPNRHNIVITSDPEKLKNKVNIKGIKEQMNLDSSQKNRDLTFVSTIESALDICKDCSEIMVIGGAKIYEQFLPLANRIYLSVINKEYEGDTYFPDYNAVKNWKKVREEKLADFSFLVLEA